MELAIRKPIFVFTIAKDVWVAICDTYLDLENSSQIFRLKSNFDN